MLEYEQASGSTYPNELMAATLIKCCQPRLMDVWTWTRPRTHQQRQRKRKTERKVQRKERWYQRRRKCQGQERTWQSVPWAVCELSRVWTLGKRLSKHGQPGGETERNSSWCRTAGNSNTCSEDSHDSEKDFPIWKSSSFLKSIFTNLANFLQQFPGAYGFVP